jgi:hypothetical protein
LGSAFDSEHATGHTFPPSAEAIAEMKAENGEKGTRLRPGALLAFGVLSRDSCANGVALMQAIVCLRDEIDTLRS